MTIAISIVLLTIAAHLHHSRLKADISHASLTRKAHLMTTLSLATTIAMLTASASVVAIYLAVIASWLACSLSATMANQSSIPSTIVAGR